MKESGAKNSSGNSLTLYVGLSPPYKIGASALEVDTILMSKARCAFGRVPVQEAVVVQRLLIKVDTTNFGMPSCSVAEGATERGAAGGSAIALARCASTDPPCGLGVLTVGLDAKAVFNAGGRLGKTALREVVATGRLFHQICAANLSTTLCSVAGGVTESGAADGSADDLADCASKAPPCSHCASTFGLDSVVLLTTGCALGGVAPNEVVAVEMLLIQVHVLNLSMLPCSIGESVTEDGTGEGSPFILNLCFTESVTEDVAEDVTGQIGTLVGTALQKVDTVNGVLIQVIDRNLWAPHSPVTKGVTESINVDVTVKRGDRGGSTPSKIDNVKGVSQDVAKDVKGQRGEPAGAAT